MIEEKIEAMAIAVGTGTGCDLVSFTNANLTRRDWIFLPSSRNRATGMEQRRERSPTFVCRLTQKEMFALSFLFYFIFIK